MALMVPACRFPGFPAMPFLHGLFGVLLCTVFSRLGITCSYTHFDTRFLWPRRLSVRSLGAHYGYLKKTAVHWIHHAARVRGGETAPFNVPTTGRHISVLVWQVWFVNERAYRSPSLLSICTCCLSFAVDSQTIDYHQNFAILQCWHIGYEQVRITKNPFALDQSAILQK